MNKKYPRYDRNALPEHMVDEEDYLDTVRSMQWFSDFKEETNNILWVCTPKFSTQELSSALEDFTIAVTDKFSEEGRFWLVAKCFRHMSNFYRARLDALASVQDFKRAPPLDSNDDEGVSDVEKIEIEDECDCFDSDEEIKDKIVENLRR